LGKNDRMTIMEDSRVKKPPKLYTPFSYGKSAHGACDQLFRRFADSILALSYSSNGYAELPQLRQLMSRYKRSVDVLKRPDRYHFGTHSGVQRATADEYLIVGYRTYACSASRLWEGASPRIALPTKSYK
jgi:adenine-specific DNA-methyltransferase